MQTVVSLLNLQAAEIKDKVILEKFNESRNRIQSMALIQEKLYASTDLTHIDFNNYVEELILYLFQSYGKYEKQIDMKINIGRFYPGIDTAIPCGLIITELVSNSLKYAFPKGQTGIITVSVKASSDHLFELVVSDNGVGFPAHIDYKKSPSLGLKLVALLAEGQLKGEFKLQKANGTKFIIKWRQRQYSK